ncbi:auxin-responsive protein IAA29 [Tanacetum coccineum]
MELHLGLALSSSSSSGSSCSSHFDLNGNHNYDHESVHYPEKGKYGNEDKHVPQTLPLLVWNNFCNTSMFSEDNLLDDHDGDNEVESNSIFVHQRRKNLCDPKLSNEDGNNGSMYVKVHMEGIGIARKVDLNLHNSYQTLVQTLANMFGKCYEEVKLTYQDEEGDWLLAGDVPWGSFVKTVQRLKLVRN